MAHMQYIDELVREYLLYRGFNGTVKHFDNDLKYDKDKGFRVDKIVDQFISYINTYDINSLRDLWSHLETRFFSKLEHHLIMGIKKLENSLLKLYVINAIVNNKHDKVLEFFQKMSQDLQNHPEWKEWFMLPFTKNAEDNPIFSVYFTKQWQDTLFISLHNFLATVYQCAPLPTICTFEEDVNRIRKLQEENDILRGKLAQLINAPDNNLAQENSFRSNNELYDDFYIIAQENQTSNSEDSNIRSFKSLIRNIGGGGSPINNPKKK